MFLRNKSPLSDSMKITKGLLLCIWSDENKKFIRVLQDILSVVHDQEPERERVEGLIQSAET